MTMQYKLANPIVGVVVVDSSWAKDGAAARTTVRVVAEQLQCAAAVLGDVRLMSLFLRARGVWVTRRRHCRLRARTFGSPLTLPPDPLGAVDERDRRRIGRERRRAKQAGVAGESSYGRRARWRWASAAAAAGGAPSPPKSGGARPLLRFGRRPCFARAPVSARHGVAYPLKKTREKGNKEEMTWHPDMWGLRDSHVDSAAI
uniref:H0212B02.18 protein n=1 Tax=Oryza sativa TaxID=4530 RepID=Q25AM4_ORYSA|nr:H0212B02.18 [Oryza sativa]CAJ86325.1 OSIGBa0113E10.8 [Oryza sativa]